MGYYSVIVVLHDQLGGIVKQPEVFTEDLDRAIREFSYGDNVHLKRTIRGSVGYANPASIIAQDHADAFHMLVTGGNTGWDLGTCRSAGWSRDKMTDDDRKLHWIKQIAASLGYRLVKAKSK